MTTTHPRFELPTDTGRDIIPAELLRQIGGPTLLAVSGGRWASVGRSSVLLQCGAGFAVVVTLDADDTYTVRRVFARDRKLFLHGERTDVYCDEVSEVVYFASCFRSYDPGVWETKA